MDTEYLSTAAVKKTIAMTEVLKPFIPEGDKASSWEGHVYSYKDCRKDVRVAAYLLIEEYYSARILFNELSCESQETFKSYLIYRY